MLELILTLLGGGLGGLMRLLPAVLKLFGDKKDADHEYRMTQLQVKIDAARAAADLDKIHAQGDASEKDKTLLAYIEAIKGQGQMSGVKWVDALNQSVRPVVTYWWLILFTVYKIATLVIVAATVPTLAEFVVVMWTPQDWGILSMILGFWFVDRSIRKDNGR
jgi:hypothetical protein